MNLVWERLNILMSLMMNLPNSLFSKEVSPISSNAKRLINHIIYLKNYLPFGFDEDFQQSSENDSSDYIAEKDTNLYQESDVLRLLKHVKEEEKYNQRLNKVYHTSKELLRSCSNSCCMKLCEKAIDAACEKEDCKTSLKKKIKKECCYKCNFIC